MKKYATFPIDCSTLATEAMAYLNQRENVEDASHFNASFHALAQDDVTPLVGSIPSLATTFPGLTIKLLAHVTVNSDAMYNTEYGSNILLIPLDDCESVDLKTFTIAPGAIKTDWSYADADCTLDATTPLTSATTPLLLAANTTHTLETQNPNVLADLLFIIFNENTDSYLA